MDASRSKAASDAAVAKLLVRLFELLPDVDGRDIRGMLDTAIDEAGERFDASDPTQLQLFVHGPLAAVLERIVGEDRSDEAIGAIQLQDDSVSTPSKRILVVSDEYRLRERLEDLLSAHDYHLATARNASEALASCRADMPGVVLCDIDARDGFGVCAHHRLQEMLDPCPPVVVLMGDDVELAVGHSPMLSKVLDPMAVLTMVKALIGQASPDSQPRETRDAFAAAMPSEAMRSPFAPLLIEALELVAAPNVRATLLMDALARSELDAIPDDLRAFAAFVNGALYLSIKERFGEDAADAVLEDLRTTSGIHQRAFLDNDVVIEDQHSGVRGPLVQKIVLADSDEHMLGVLSRALRESGYEVLTATNGRDALSLSLRNEPDVLVCDVDVAVLSGIDVAHLLQRMRGDYAPATVLVASDIADLGSVQGSTLMQKPIKVADLIRAIEEAAEHKLAHAL